MMESIKTRTLEIKLSDDDAMRIYEITGNYGMSVEELITNFISDLIDNKLYAQEWLINQWKKMHPDYTFLRHLVEIDRLDDFMKEYRNIEECKSEIKHSEQSLKYGVVVGDGEPYTWDELFHSDGSPIFTSKEEWEQRERDSIKQYQDEIEFSQTSINDDWSEYNEQDKEGYKNGTFDEEMEKVLEYVEKCEELLQREM